MFNPVRSYKKYVQRLDNKRKVFNSDKKTLDLQELNRFVNGTAGRPRTKPTYLLAKTRKLLGHTLLMDIDADKYGGALKPVAQNLHSWCVSPGTASNTDVRLWLKQLAEPKPVEREADEQAEDCPLADSRSAIEDRDGGARSHVSSEDDAQSRLSLEEESAPIGGDIFAEDDRAFTMTVEGLDSDDQPERHSAGSDAALRQWVDTLDKPKVENDRRDLFDRVDAKIANRGRRPAPMLRPRQNPTQTRSDGVVRLVEDSIVPAKQ